MSGSSTKRFCAARSTSSRTNGYFSSDDLLHLLLEGREVFGRERLGDLEVVVEAVVDRRAEADFRVGAQASHGRRQHVRGGMAKHVERVRVAVGEHAKRAARAERRDEVLEHAVHLDGDGGQEEAFANGLDDVGRQRSGRHDALGSVGKRERERRFSWAIDHCLWVAFFLHREYARCSRCGKA